ATRRRRDADPARGALRRSVLAETGVAVALLAVATVLSGTQPGRAETEQAAARRSAAAGPVSLTIPYDTGSKAGRGTAEATVDPGGAGSDNEVHTYLTDQAGRPVDAEELKMSFRLAEKNLGPLAVPLEHLSTGHWSAARVRLPVPGAWTLSLTVRTSDIDEVTETRTVKIGR
ncbi:hypothetical protein RKE29_19645, partial [Streptomyces sp. B1866]|nr:hypothetical protein [Streptomyces sp. B1866]